MNADFQKQFEQFAELMKSAMPKVTPSKNGYEIRTKVLEMAQDQNWQDYHASWGQYETSIQKEGNELVTKVSIPTAPSAEKVLETARQFYEFVSGTTKNKD